MLAAIGVKAVEELFADIPAQARLQTPLNLPKALTELDLVRHMDALASRNADPSAFVSFLGGGIYDHFVPAVVDAVTSRGEFATAYTPYQPELSQGMLQAIYEFQTLICALTGMDMANASMYDGATAMAEAALMLTSATGRTEVVVSRSVHPHYRQVLRTYCEAAGVTLIECPYVDGLTDAAALAQLVSDRTACVLVQYPNFFGCIEDLPALIAVAEKHGARSVVSADPVALALLKPPGEYGADVVVGEGQGIGLAMGFGGPLLGFFACKSEYQRRFPGRIVGMTHDSSGRRGFTMTLRTREQDIRREKATSNICTNEALMALAASVHLCALGPEGLREVADLCLQKAHYAHDRLTEVVGVRPAFRSPFFKEFVVSISTQRPVHDLCRALIPRGLLAGYSLGESYPELQDGLLIAVTERRTKAEIDLLVEAIREEMPGGGG
jgi:glycine dehydrogenase subunit 1